MYSSEEPGTVVASVFAGVLWTYYNSRDPGMTEAAFRLVRRCRDILGYGQRDLELAEVATIIHLASPLEGSCDMYAALLTTCVLWMSQFGLRKGR